MGIGGELWGLTYIYTFKFPPAMTILHGEYECRIDDKGRIILPAGSEEADPAGSAGEICHQPGF